MFIVTILKWKSLILLPFKARTEHALQVFPGPGYTQLLAQVPSGRRAFGEMDEGGGVSYEGVRHLDMLATPVDSLGTKQ